MAAAPGRMRMVVAVVVLIAVLLGAQAIAYSTQPSSGISAAASMGKAGFAYLGGLRTFAAAVIWNRIDPQSHEYFDGVTLTDQTFVVPKMRLVTLLDPSFIDGFYVTSWIVFERIGAAEGIDVAREGLLANPNSGILRANLAQLLFVADKSQHRAEILRLAASVVDSGTVWSTDDEQYEGFAIAMNALGGLGNQEAAAAVQKQLDAWRAEGRDLGDHDHDRDGKQDH